jgi:hypothetical protein
MNTANLQNQGFSAAVDMQLRVNGHVFSIGQLGPDFVMLKDPADHPPAAAEITVTIDGRVRCWTVQLVDGIIARERRTRIADLE